MCFVIGKLYIQLCYVLITLTFLYNVSISNICLIILLTKSSKYRTISYLSLTCVLRTITAFNILLSRTFCKIKKPVTPLDSSFQLAKESFQYINVLLQSLHAQSDLYLKFLKQSSANECSFTSLYYVNMKNTPCQDSKNQRRRNSDRYNYRQTCMYDILNFYFKPRLNAKYIPHRSFRRK